MINYDLQKIRTIIFDIDGVLSAETISLGDDGQPRRTVNIKDGYAIQLAQKMGLRIAIITGCKIEAVATRYRGLGVEDIFLGCAVKMSTYENYLACTWATTSPTWKLCVVWAVLFVPRMPVRRSSLSASISATMQEAMAVGATS